MLAPITCLLGRYHLGRFERFDILNLSLIWSALLSLKLLKSKLLKMQICQFTRRSSIFFLNRSFASAIKIRSRGKSDLAIWKSDAPASGKVITFCLPFPESDHFLRIFSQKVVIFCASLPGKWYFLRFIPQKVISFRASLLGKCF